MIKKINYEDKVALQNDISILSKNKVTADDMNEIKEVVNNNADSIETLNRTATSNEERIETIQNSTTIQTETLIITSAVEKETDYELSSSYKVGSNLLRIYWNGTLLKQGEDGNYIEIGTNGETSNIVKFGFELEVGDILTIEVRGVVNEE